MKQYKMCYIYATKLWVAHDMETGLRIASEANPDDLEKFVENLGYKYAGIHHSAYGTEHILGRI